MSRSIHTTWRTLRELAAREYADPEAKDGLLRRARRELRRKYFLKRQVEAERKGGIEIPSPHPGVALIPIEVLEPSRSYIHHACTVADIRAVLAALPSEAVEGIGRIQLGLGKEYIEESCADEEKVDPYYGRRSCEIYPGVFAGVVLGVYSSESALIRLHAYVFDAERLPLPAEVNAGYLRLHALATLVHEVAHHHDHTRRVRRGRWLADRKENAEWYAEKMEHAWVREAVLPYLEKAYPHEVQTLLGWVEQEGGVRLPLEFFIGDPRITTRNGLTCLRCDGDTAFEDWVDARTRCASVVESRLALAWELHYIDKFDLCLQVIGKIRAQEPDHTGARECLADTLVHLERWEEAHALASQLLSENPLNSAALEVFGDFHEEKREWPELLALCERWQKADPACRGILLFRTVALCALGRDTEMEAALDQFLLRCADIPEAVRSRIRSARRRGIFRRAGRVESVQDGGKPSPVFRHP